MNGRALGSGSMETQGSPVRCLVVVAAAAAQCPAPGELPGGGPPTREEIPARRAHRGAGLSPRGWEQGLASPRDAVRFPSGTQPCPGPPGGGFVHGGVDDPKELWGGRGSHGSLGGPGRSSVLCGWSGGGREQPRRVLQRVGWGHCGRASPRSGGRKAPAGTRTASGASANSRGQRSPAREAGARAAGHTLGLNFWPGGPGRRWGSPGPEFAPSPSPGLSLALPSAAERGLGSSLLPRQSLSWRSSPSGPGMLGPSPSPSGDTRTQSCPRVARGSGVSRGMGVFLGAQSSVPPPQCKESSGVGRNSWVTETHLSQLLVGSRFIFYWSL